MHPERPDRLLAHRARAAALRHHARRRLHRRGAQLPGRAGDHRRARHAHLQGGRRAHQRARPRAARPTASSEGDGVAIMCRNHRGWIDAVLACSKLGANALFLNTAFSGPQLTDVAKREKPKAVIYDHEFAEVLEDAATRRKRYVAWHDPEDGKAKDPSLEDLIARGDTAPLNAPSEQGRAIILTCGHDRDAEGRLALDAQVDRPDRRAAVGDPAARAREDDDRRAAVSRLGLRAVGARHQPRDDRRAQAQVRRGGDALADRPARVQRARRGAGDDPAHPRARRRGPRSLRPLARSAPCPCQRLRAARLDLRPLDGPLRREPLQPLRLDRGRVGDDRHAARPARGAGHRRAARRAAAS